MLTRTQQIKLMELVTSLNGIASSAIIHPSHQDEYDSLQKEVAKFQSIHRRIQFHEREQARQAEADKLKPKLISNELADSLKKALKK